jgi:hypothetical protein
MSKKTYFKPMASFIAFYSEKDMTANQDINDYANQDGDISTDLSDATGGDIGVGGGDSGWID